MEKLPTVDIHGKEYVLVKDRILAFHELYKEGSIKTEKTSEGLVVGFKAVVETGDGRTFTGHAESVRGGTGVNKDAACENAETSAVGRALGMLGIGVLESVASADEVVKASIPVIQADGPRCMHNEPAKRLQVKNGKPENVGRYFFACAHKKGDQCDYFQFEDEINEAPHEVIDETMRKVRHDEENDDWRQEEEMRLANDLAQSEGRREDHVMSESHSR